MAKRLWIAMALLVILGLGWPARGQVSNAPGTAKVGASISPRKSALSPEALLTPQEQQWLSTQKVRIGITQIPPQVLLTDDEEKYQGLVIDYIRLVERNVGCPFELVYYDTWDELMQAANGREIDVIFAAQQTPERLKTFLFSKPFIELPNMIVVRKTMKGDFTLDKMRGMKIAVSKGSVVQDYLVKDFGYLDLLPVTNEMAGLIKVSFSEADAMIVEMSRASYYIDQAAILNLRVAGEAGLVFKLRFATRKDWPILNDVLDKGLAAITDQERQEITRRWIKVSGQGFIGSKTFWYVFFGGAVVVISILIGIVTWNRALKQQVMQRTDELQRELLERRQAEAALREAEARYRFLVENTTDQFARLSLDGTMLFASGGIRALQGYEPEEVIGTLGLTRVHPEDHPVVQAALKQLAESSERSVKIEYRLIRKDGQHTWVEAIGKAVPNTSNGKMEVVAVIRDINERKRIEQTLRESETRLLQAQAVAHVGNWELDLASKTMWASEEAFRIYGFERTTPYMPLVEVQRCPLPEYRPNLDRALAALIQTNQPCDQEFRIRRANDNALRAIHTVATLVCDAKGAPMKVLGVIQDITELKAAEIALREREQILRYIVEHAPNAIAVLDQHLHYVAVSKRFLLDYNVQDVDIIGKHHYEVFPNIPERWKDVHQRCLMGEVEKNEDDRSERPDGAVAYSRWECRPWYRGDGGIGGIVLYSEIITERKLADLALRASLEEKIALLKEVHHRVKNNLQIVSSLLNMQSAQAKNQAALEVLRESQNRVRSMALIHETLYRSENLARVNFGQYIDNLCGHLFASYGSVAARIQLVRRVDEVTLNLNQAVPCGLIINELLSNALKYAFPQERAGIITLELHQEAGQIHLRVSDNGIGLPPELDVRKTETLGLRLVVMLSRQLRGTVAVERDQGAAIHITFPVQAEEVA